MIYIFPYLFCAWIVYLISRVYIYRDDKFKYKPFSVGEFDSSIDSFHGYHGALINGIFWPFMLPLMALILFNREVVKYLRNR